MRILEKIGKGMDKVVARTNEALDLGSLRSKIDDEERNIEKRKAEIGELYYLKHADAQDMDGDFEEMFSSIEESLRRIREYEENIAEIKSGR